MKLSIEKKQETVLKRFHFETCFVLYTASWSVIGWKFKRDNMLHKHE
jgi:hypothetical protein